MGLAPSPDYRNKVNFVSTQHPFLLLVPIIDHTFIFTNCYTLKLFFIFVTNLVLRSFNNVGRLKRMLDFHPPSEKNVGGSSAV